ncbi:hypothetical protein POTOM_031796 [Populus tomentosa]|uniref:Uncharacterized protein n=1 Tax=Populus tomentosa TaxID=118781 RepID=A0A8X8CS14_POPTO|nr:hypothetical protein POTOM_031796 [Populus tomentosa]
MFLHDYPELYCATTEHGDPILYQRSQIVHWIIECQARDFYIGNNMYSKCKVVHCHGMVGAGGPYLPIFLAHHPQLHVETPFPSSHALYLMVVLVRANENDLHECIKATLCHIFVPVPSSPITVKKLVSESHGCKSTYVFTLSTIL